MWLNRFRAYTWRRFLGFLVDEAVLVGIMGIGLKLVSFWDTGYWYFPFYPNILDSALLVLGSLYIGIRLWTAEPR